MSKPLFPFDEYLDDLFDRVLKFFEGESKPRPAPEHWDGFFRFQENPIAPLAPTYFVIHPNGHIIAADPQPTVDLYGRGLPMKEVENKQLRFLLSQAPMIDAPADLFNAGRAVTKYAYVHPKTFAAFTKGSYAPLTSAPYVRIKPSGTKWVITSLMPEKQVIYTPNALPGIEKLLAS